MRPARREGSEDAARTGAGRSSIRICRTARSLVVVITLIAHVAVAVAAGVGALASRRAGRLLRQRSHGPDGHHRLVRIARSERCDRVVHGVLGRLERLPSLRAVRLVLLAYETAADNSGRNPSFLFDADGDPQSSHSRPTINGLMHAVKLSEAWTTEAAYAARDGGGETFLAPLSTGNPRIAYADSATLNLHSESKSVLGWSFPTVDTTRLTLGLAFALDAGNLSHIPGQLASVHINRGGAHRVLRNDAEDLMYANLAPPAGQRARSSMRCCRREPRSLRRGGARRALVRDARREWYGARTPVIVERPMPRTTTGDTTMRPRASRSMLSGAGGVISLGRGAQTHESRRRSFSRTHKMHRTLARRGNPDGPCVRRPSPPSRVAARSRRQS